MRILRADAMGMCFGVRDALAEIQQVEQPARVTVHGELVHNREVLAMLDERGFGRSDEATRAVPSTEAVLITAHGVSERERGKLIAAGKRLLDTTCPLVLRVHEVARQLHREGRRLIVLGRADHVEVRGIVEDHDRAVVVGRDVDVVTWPERRLGVICQTTMAPERAAALLAAIRRANPAADVRFVDTVCNPTKARGQALEELLPRIDVLVVVGGKASNNTRKLAARGRRRGVPTLHVENERELDPVAFRGCRVVGLTAGTSTLDTTIDAVHAWLLDLAARSRDPSA